MVRWGHSGTLIFGLVNELLGMCELKLRTVDIKMYVFFNHMLMHSNTQMFYVWSISSILLLFVIRTHVVNLLQV